MKYSLALFIAILLSWKSYAQQVFAPLIYEQQKEIQLKKSFIEFQSTSKKHVPLSSNWTILNFSYLDIVNPQSFNPFSQRDFLNGLKFDTPIISVCHQVFDIDNNTLVYEVFTGEESRSMKFLSFIPMFNNGKFKSLNFLSENFKLNEIYIFFIQPLDEMFIVNKGIVYVVIDQKIYKAHTYLKRKYKTSVKLMKEIGYKVQA